jgi:hypothetical protein
LVRLSGNSAQRLKECLQRLTRSKICSLYYVRSLFWFL